MNKDDRLPIPFDDYEISGVRQFGAGTDRYCEQVDDEDAQFWSLYGHILGEGVDCIADFKSREAAEEMYARITGRTFRDRQTTARVKRFGKVVCEYGDDDNTGNFIDLLTDAKHWCRANSVSFDHSLKTAAKHFAAETKEGTRS